MTKFIEQRVEVLENEVAELKLIVHELRGKKSIEPSTTNTVEDIIEFEGQQYRKVDREAQVGDVVIFQEKGKHFTGKGTYITIGNPYKVSSTHDDGRVKFIADDDDDILVYGSLVNRTPETVDVYELIEEGLNPQIPIVDETIEPLTPNQQRAAIIEKSKTFVKNIVGEYDTFNTTVGRYKDQCVRPIFHVNEKKRAITVLIYGAFGKQLIFKGITKCNPSDVFNEHIGKAIALGRALGLDVSEFEQAVQPTEFVSEQIITYTSELAGQDRGGNFEISYIEDDTLWFHDEEGYDLFGDDWKPKIINDTNAKYEEG